jgi:hypothetical protein
MCRNGIIKPHLVAKAAQDCGNLLCLPGCRAGAGDEDV